MKVSKSAGFTLVEILIVVGVLSLLIGIFIPRLVNARTSAQNSAAQVYAYSLLLWLASAEADNETLLLGSLVGDCVSTELQTQGAPNTLPNSVSDCVIAFEDGHYRVKVTSVSEKGGLAGDGIFITYY